MFSSVQGAIQTNVLSTNVDEQCPSSKRLFYRCIRSVGFSCLPATAWLNSIFSLPCVIARAELHCSPIQLSSYDHSDSYIKVVCVGMWTQKLHFIHGHACFLWEHESLLCLWLKWILYWQCFLFAIYPFSLLFALCPPMPPSCTPPSQPPSCSFCTCLSRCKQVHAPLIPAPAGPPQCGAVWGNGGHGTRRGFWIQSIQKRPGSILAKF